MRACAPSSFGSFVAGALLTFPFCVKQAQAQIAYIKHALATHPPSRAKGPDSPIPHPKSLFTRWLKQSPSVDLWRMYLQWARCVIRIPLYFYVLRQLSRTMNLDMKKAYEGALECIGQDKDSGELWKEWLAIVEAEPTHNVHEEQQKMDAMRKIYRRAVQIPLNNVEALWRELDAFENKLNKVTVSFLLFSFEFSCSLCRRPRNSWAK